LHKLGVISFLKKRKMKKSALVFILFCSIAFSQETVTKNFGDFNELKVYNGLTVEIQKSNTSKIEISGSQSSDVIVKNVDGVLKIRLRIPDSFVAKDIKVKLFYENLNVLDANEGSIIVSKELIKQKHLEVRVQEGAKINLKVNTKHLNVKAVTGGIIELSGKVGNQIIKATTGGIYKSFHLISEQTIVVAASGAKVETNTTELLDAKVRFGGTILYKGELKILNTKKFIGGSIKLVDYLDF